MTGYLLDMDVASELLEVAPQARAIAFIAAKPLDDLNLSDVTPKYFAPAKSLTAPRQRQQRG